MITNAHVHVMARYNRWQNRSLIAAADTLDDADRLADRGGFWGGIQSTMVHVLWGDLIWMARFDNWHAPRASLGESTSLVGDWDEYCDARESADRDILAWAGRLETGELDGELAWYSATAGRDLIKPKWLLVQHFFNHQTHHRGQVHAMLTAAGASPGDTDLFLMPEDA